MKSSNPKKMIEAKAGYFRYIQIDRDHFQVLVKGEVYKTCNNGVEAMQIFLTLLEGVYTKYIGDALEAQGINRYTGEKAGNCDTIGINEIVSTGRS